VNGINGLGQLGQVVAQSAQQLNQGVAQLNAHVRQLADGAAQAINGFYLEGKRAIRAFDEQRGLRYRPATITLSANIVGAGTAVSGSADFRVAQNEDFFVQSMRGFVMMTDLPAEVAGGVPATMGTTVQDRLIAKAQNCRFTLLNKDTKVPITENEGLSLASITPEANGEILRFSPDIVPGFIIPHNMTVQVQFALQDNDAFFNTAATIYGITLTGVYTSREFR